MKHYLIDTYLDGTQYSQFKHVYFILSDPIPFGILEFPIFICSQESNIHGRQNPDSLILLCSPIFICRFPFILSPCLSHSLQ